MRDDVDPEDHRFVPGSWDFWEIWTDTLFGDGPLSSPGAADCTNLGQLAMGRWGWGFYTVRDGIDPGNHRFRPQFVGFVHVWEEYCSGDGTLSSAGAAGSTNPRQSAISQWGWCFRTLPGGIDPGC